MTAPAFITTGDGCRIAWRFDGPKNAPVLLLSNSLGTTMAMWAAQIDAFTRDFRVLRYDSRGHGASDVPPGAYSLDRLGRDAIELLDALDIATIHFCGLSKGGMVGQWLGVRAPERIDRLILCNTSPYMGPPGGWDDRIAAVVGGGMAAIGDAVIERWFTPGFRASGDPAPDAIRTQLLATDPKGYAGCCAAIRDMDMRQIATLIDRPTLVIGGDADPATPVEHSLALAGTIPGAALEILHAAHLSNVEQPAAFTRAALTFLT
jgi:3-oxoadipate enol-lactonase